MADDIRARYNALMARPPPKGVPCKNMKTFLLCCFGVLLLVIIMIIVAVETNKALLPQTETCSELYPGDPDYGPVGCRVCAQGARSNDISHMPFVNVGLGPVSHNLGTYEVVNVNGSSVRSTLDPKQMYNDFIAVKGGSTPQDPGNYIQALALYFVFAVFMCVFTAVLGCGILMCKFCCNCSCCGRRYPTEKTGHWLGFEFEEETKTFQYSNLSRWSTRLFMATFAFFLALWLGLGQVNGNLGMTQAMKALTHAPDGLVDVLHGVIGPIAQLLEDLIGDTFVGLFRDLNRTVTQDVNLLAIIDGVECILNKLGSFPNSTILRDFVGDLQVVFGALQRVLGNSTGALAVVDAELDTVRFQVTGIRNYIIGEFTIELLALLQNLTALKQECDIFNGYTAVILNDSCCASKASSDILQLQTNATNNQSDYGSMEFELQAIFNYNYPGGQDAHLFLAAMLREQTDMMNAPDLNLTANELDRHNNETQEAINQKKAHNLVIGIEQTNDFLSNNVSGFTATLNATILNLTANVLRINLDPIRDIILSFNATTYDLPDFSIVFGFIGSLFGISQTMFPCMTTVSQELVHFDQNVAKLPAEFLNIDSIITAVNNSLQPAIDAIDNVNRRKSQLDDARNKFNISDKLNTLNDTEFKLIGYVDDINNDELIDEVFDAENKSHLNISILPDVIKVNESLPSWMINTSTIANIRTAEQARRQLNQDLPILNVDLPLWHRYCSLNVSVSCYSTPCGAFGVCLGPMNRCANNTKNCSFDSECAPTYRCLTDKNRINRTIYNLKIMELLIYNTSNTSGVGGIKTTLDDARSNSHVDTSGLEEGIREANRTLRRVETGNITKSLNDVITNLNNFNSSEFRKEIDDINASLNAIDFQSIISQINAADDAFAQVDAAKSDLDSAYQLLNATYELFFVRLPIVIDDFGLPKLRQVRAAGGVSATLEYLASTIDRETAWLDQAAGKIISGANSTGGFATNFTGDLAPYRDLIYTICDANYGTYGSTYYLLQLAKSLSQGGGFTGKIFDPDGSENMIDKNKAGNTYPGGKMCVATTCLDNSIDWVNGAPISEVSGGLIPVSLSREQSIGLPYIVPLLILICATISAALFCRTSQLGWWSSSLATCTCVGAFCCMPFIFMIVGMLFPLVIVSGDICYSAENVGWRVLSMEGNSVCSGMTGTGTITDCVIPWTVRNQTRYSHIDILDTYKSLVAPGCDPNQGAIHDAFEQAKDAFAEMPSLIIENFVNSTDNTSFPIEFRYPIKMIFVDAARGLSVHARNFGTGLSQALSCSQMYKIYESFKGAVCCDVMSAFYWALGSWYLIAWTLLCCGCCAGLFGRKRFAYELWGEEYMKLKDTSRIQAEWDEDKPRPREDSETPPRKRSITPTSQPAFQAPPSPVAMTAPVAAATSTEVFVSPPAYQQPLAYEPPAPAYVPPPEEKGVELTAYPAKTIEDF